MKAFFFDLDTLVETNSKVWLVDKTQPNIPIVKISKSDYNLVKKGLFRKIENKLLIGDEEYFFPEDLLNKIKINCKNSKTDISNLRFSMQEFINKELIENLEYRVNLENILHLKNKTDDIYIVCSKNTKKNYEKFILKLEEKLEENGLKIKDYYFISETFYNRDEDKINHKKARLLLQHIVGYKTEVDKFSEKEIKEYDEIDFYDDESTAIDMCKNSINILQFILSNTEKNLSDRIKQKIKEKDKVFQLNLVTSNKVNRFIKTTLILKLPNLFKTFESFSWSKFRN